MTTGSWLVPLWAEGWVHSPNVTGDHTPAPPFPCLSFCFYVGCFRAVCLYSVPTLGFPSTGCAMQRVNVPITLGRGSSCGSPVRREGSFVVVNQEPTLWGNCQFTVTPSHPKKAKDKAYGKVFPAETLLFILFLFFLLFFGARCIYWKCCCLLFM